MRSPANLPEYEHLPGLVPVLHAPEIEEQALEAWVHLERGAAMLAEMLDVEPPELEAFLVTEEDWDKAPREGEHAYPPGLPYFTRSVSPPALVLPVALSSVFRPRTEVTYPLVVWHELTHAFLLRGEVVRTPAWLGEFVPQAAAAAVARRTRLPLEEHLSMIDRDPGFTVRSSSGPADAETQMAFQNLLLVLGAGAVEEFGEEPLERLVRTLWRETEVVDEERAVELLAGALGPGGREWLLSRPEFQEV